MSATLKSPEDGADRGAAAVPEGEGAASGAGADAALSAGASPASGVAASGVAASDGSARATPIREATPTITRTDHQAAEMPRIRGRTYHRLPAP